jgi:hypothetical protein
LELAAYAACVPSIANRFADLICQSRPDFVSLSEVATACSSTTQSATKEHVVMRKPWLDHLGLADDGLIINLTEDYK